MHGARGGAPEGERNGNYRHGARTKEASELRSSFVDWARSECGGTVHTNNNRSFGLMLILTSYPVRRRFVDDAMKRAGHSLSAVDDLSVPGAEQRVPIW